MWHFLLLALYRDIKLSFLVRLYMPRTRRGKYNLQFGFYSRLLIVVENDFVAHGIALAR